MVGQKPWIVCPRRLLTLHGRKLSPQQIAVRDRIVRYGSLSPTKEYRVWSEVKMTVPMTDRSKKTHLFNYTFDYVLADKTSMPTSRISNALDMSEDRCLRIAEGNGLEIVRRDGEVWIDDWPSEPLVIVEVMSSSTSGGNKRKRTQISMAFEDALLKGEEHEGPGINYRQVWARMASQLIVKSQVATAWNAKTIWILQDVLADYISTTTGLDLEAYAAERSNEVNILSIGYDDGPDESGVLRTVPENFYSGPVSTQVEDGVDGGFVDIVKVGSVPPVRYLWKALFRKIPCGVLGR